MLRTDRIASRETERFLIRQDILLKLYNYTDFNDVSVFTQESFEISFVEFNNIRHNLVSKKNIDRYRFNDMETDWKIKYHINKPVETIKCWIKGSNAELLLIDSGKSSAGYLKFNNDIEVLEYWVRGDDPNRISIVFKKPKNLLTTT